MSADHRFYFRMSPFQLDLDSPPSPLLPRPIRYNDRARTKSVRGTYLAGNYVYLLVNKFISSHEVRNLYIEKMNVGSKYFAFQLNTWFSILMLHRNYLSSTVGNDEEMKSFISTST